jgi:hypothetical protein
MADKPKGLGPRKGSKFDLQQDGEGDILRPNLSKNEKGNDQMWELMQTYLKTDVPSIQR